jgi:hypothetical protein
VLASDLQAGAEIPKTNRAPYAAPADQALLVLRRPRQRQASEVTVRVVDEGGRCIAILQNDWQVVAPLWPGKHMLMVIAGTAPPTVQLLHARVSSGKTYLVDLRMRVNVKSPVGIEVARRSNQPLEAFPPAVRERGPFEPDLRKCTEWVSWKRPKISAKASEAKRRWDEATEEYREGHTVHRNDGWTADEVAGP